MRNNKLLILAYVTLAVSLLVCGLSVYLILKSQSNIKIQIRDSLQEEIKKYNIPVNDKATVDELTISLAVAKYCEANNSCRGLNGRDGASGKDGLNGIDGLDGLNGGPGADGYTPIKGVDYFDGEKGDKGDVGPQGEPGADGREIERRCNSNKNRMEWRYVGDLGWQVEYKLAPGQVCG